MRVLIALVLACTAVMAVPRKNPRIVGGSEANIADYPEMVSLMLSWIGVDHRHNCGGFIINNRAIMTAAHCTIRQSERAYVARVGSSFHNRGGKIYQLSRIINHENYDSRTADNDIAILHIIGTFDLTEVVQPARVAGSKYKLGDNEVVWASGWGRLSPWGASPEQLHHVQIWTVNQQVCKERYARLGYTVTDNMLCSGWLDVGGRDQCQGDSGSPLFHNRVVVGICSWGESCALAQYPGVNARVSQYTNWIQDNN